MISHAAGPWRSTGGGGSKGLTPLPPGPLKWSTEGPKLIPKCTKMEALGVPWTPLGGPWGTLGGPWGTLGGSFGRRVSFLVIFGHFLGPFWTTLGDQNGAKKLSVFEACFLITF